MISLFPNTEVQREGLRRIVWSLFFFILIATRFVANSLNATRSGISIEIILINHQTGLFGQKCAQEGSLQRKWMAEIVVRLTKDPWKK